MAGVSKNLGVKMSSSASQRFLVSYHALEDTKLEIEKVVNAANFRHSGRQLRVSYLRVKLLAHIETQLNIIINHFQFAIDARKRFKARRTRFYPFDHHSICSLGRVCFDASLMLHYISEPKLTIDEWNLRRKVLYLHDHLNRKRFLTSAKAIAGDEVGELDDQSWITDGLVSDIKRHVEELGLKPDDKYWKGQIVFVNGVRGAVREAGWDLNQFEFQQVYLSNFIHTHPVSFIRSDEHRIDYSKPSEAQFAAAQVAVITSDFVAKSALARTNKFLREGGDPLARHFDDNGMEINTRFNL